LTGFEAAIVFGLVVAPGYLLVHGYRRLGTYSLPSRDLYALAQAVVVSLAWLVVVWLVLLWLGDPIHRWGVIPRNTTNLDRHRSDLALLIAAMVFPPYFLGLAAGAAIRGLQESERAERLLGWTGLFEPPTAWDRAWSTAKAAIKDKPDGSRYVDVTVHLKSGTVVTGRWGGSGDTDLWPKTDHNIYFASGYGVATDDSGETRLDRGRHGVFVDASDVAAVYFTSIPEDQ
jgi:uncharacterized protein DUF6338